MTAQPFVELDNLTAMAWRSGDRGLYLTTQDGTVRRVIKRRIQKRPVLDLRAKVTKLQPGSERGLLGIAFDPVDGRMFVHYTDRANDDTHIDSYVVRNGTALPRSRRQVAVVQQPGVGHNGGQLAFDADGNLLVGLGDGGGSNGRDAQDMQTLLGAIIRITPHRDRPGYGIPKDNPFVGRRGVRPEIWAKGLRNPWRFSIDDETGDLWLGDVGQDDVEEIDRIPAGRSGLNFGWYYFEGSRRRHHDAPAKVVAPVFEYPHEVGSAVIGGYVYRGGAIPKLAGAYIFADLGGIVWALGANGAVQLPVTIPGAVTSLGEGPDGELYVLTLHAGAFRLVPA